MLCATVQGDFLCPKQQIIALTGTNERGNIMSIRTLSEIRIEADEKKKVLNDAIIADSFSEVGKAKEGLEKLIKEYNALAIKMDFKTLCSKSDPMKEAIEQLNIATINLKPNEDKDSGIITYTMEPASKQIDLVAFDDFCKNDNKTIAPNRFWMYKVEKFALLATYRVMGELGLPTKKLEETYYISDIAKQIDMGKTPTSNNAMLKQLQAIVDSIIYEADGDKNIYKATSHDVAYLVAVMSKRSKSGMIVTPRSTTMHQLIMDVLHRIVSNGDYKVEYRTKKDAKSENESAEKESK